MIILVLISLTIVLLYYTQDFTEDFNFISSINYANIEIETNTFGNPQETYLLSAKSKIGELTLKNNGYFTQVYSLPGLIGCIDLKDGIYKNSLLLRNTRFTTEFTSDGVSYRQDFYSSRSNQIKIKVGEEKTFTITGIYNPNSIHLSQFSRDNIKSISLFIIPKKTTNPLSEDYPYRSLIYTNDCAGIDPDLEPIATISII